MAVTIFRDKDCKGKSQTISGNIPDLKDHPVDKPSSIRLTDDDEAVLLFKNDDWHGGALYIRGPRTVEDLGSAKDGGRFGFGNSIRSIRLNPFRVRLNVNVVTRGSDMPGEWQDRKLATIAVHDIVNRVNAFLTSRRALLECDVARISFRNDDRHFDLSNMESWSFPGGWKEKGEIDVVVVDRFTKDDVGGRTKLPCFGKTLTIAARGNRKGRSDLLFSNEDMAAIFVHELGHYLGLGHGTADKDSKNIMFDTWTVGASLSSMELWTDQVREMHDRLANNLARKGDRD